MNIINRIKSIHPDLNLFILAVICFGFSGNIIDSTFNNYLNETFTLNNFQRTILEIPRETPGLLVIFISALFFFASSRRLAAISLFIAGIGSLLLGLCKSDYTIMLAWLFIYSAGQHIFLPLISSVGMSLAHEGKVGKRLGQVNGIRDFAAILGSFIVFIGFKYLNFDFATSFIIATIGFMTGAVLMFMMSQDKPIPIKDRFMIKKEYKLFYWLNILFGTRKQIFLTFAPWVLVRVFEQKTQTVAILLTIGGIIGIFFKPALGKAIDRLGERAILAGEAIVLIFVCLGYGYAAILFDASAALYVACTCYILDQILMAVGMARSTYLQKIALRPEDVAPTLAMGVTIDHVFSIAIAVSGGIIWLYWGYHYIFLTGAVIAAINLISVMRIKTK